MPEAKKLKKGKGKPRPYGTGSYLFYENTRRYKARYFLPNGKAVYHWTATASEADAWLDEQVAIVKEGKLPISGKSVTVTAFVERWLQNISTEAARGKTSPPGPNTMEGNRYKVRNYLVRPYGRFKMAELEREHIEALYSWLRAGQTLPNRLGVEVGVQLARKPLKAQGIRHFHDLLSHLFDDAEFEKVIQETPMPRRKPGIPEEEAFVGVALEPSELWRVLEEADKRDNGAAVVTEALLGCRRGEMLGLRWEDVHLNDEVPWLVLRRSVQRVKGNQLQALRVKTVKSLRPVAISQALVDALSTHRKSPWTGHEWVFASPKLIGKGMSPEYFHRNVWSPIRDAAGVVCRPHDLRVTLRTLTHLEGVPEGISMGFFGWTRESTAEHYTQLKKVAEQTVPMAKSIDKILGLATPLPQKQSGQPTDGGEAET